MSFVPGKIVLKSSTSKTLSDRFGELAKTSRVDDIRSKQREQSSATIKNKRLAANMAKRLGDSFDENSTPGRKPVKTRLGLSLANRLGSRGQGLAGRTQRQQTNIGNMTTRSGGLQRGAAPGRGRGRGRGVYNQRGGGRGGRGGLASQGSKRGKAGRGGANRGMVRGKATVRGGRGRGRGAASGKSVTQAQLDKELDQYMSKTKFALNAELDQYMNTGGK